VTDKVLHYLCKCEAGGSGSQGVMAEVIESFISEHAQMGHVVERWYRGDRKNHTYVIAKEYFSGKEPSS